MLRHLFSVLIGLSVSCASGAALAGALERGDGDLCDWTLSGALSGDDAERLDQAAAAGPARTLCLNASGADMSAAWAVLTRVRAHAFQTRILPGHNCTDACGLAFLGGAVAHGAAPDTFPFRELWAGGRLAFPRPMLAAQADQAETVLDLAYRLFALKRQTDLRQSVVSDYLFLRLLGPRQSDPFEIATVGDALLSGVTIVGLNFPLTPSEATVRHVCDASYITHRLSETPQPKDDDPAYLNAVNEIAALRWSRTKPPTTAIRLAQDGRSIFAYAGPYPSGSRYWRRECYVTFIPEDIAAYSGEHAADGITGIAVEFRDTGQTERDPANFDFAEWSRDTRLVGAFDMPPLSQFPFEAAIDGLPRNKAAAAVLAAAGGSVGGSSAAADFARFQGYDLPGGDIGQAPAQTGAACMAACRADPQNCDAATFDRWNGICLFKSFETTDGALYLRPKSDSFIAGAHIAKVDRAKVAPVILRRQGKAFFDQPDFYFDGPSFEACAAQCQETETCNGFNYIAPQSACQVFSRPPEFFDRDGSEIGLKYQPY